MSLIFYIQCPSCCDVDSFQESPHGEVTGEPKMEASGSGGGRLSGPSGSFCKPAGAPGVAPGVAHGGAPPPALLPGAHVVSYVSLPSKPLVKLDPSLSAASKPSFSVSSLSPGDRFRRPPSPMEALMGSPRRSGDTATHSTSHLTSSDILKGPRPYQR